jgi:hypothetical protein
MEKLLKRTDAAMEGDGFYNRNSAMQAAGIARVLPIWEKICSSVPVGDETLVIADYGSSQGRNSMAPMRAAIAALRAKAGPDRVVEVVHIDLPSNDFASLFKAIVEDPGSYMNGATRIFPSAVGRSYFGPVVAPGTVHLGWNSWTLQWLSRSPVEVADHVLAGFSEDQAAIMAVREQAAQDWRDFIAARAEELRVGAKLFCLFAGADDDRRTWAWLFGELWGAAVDMSEAGLLSEHELMRMTLPLAARTLDDIKAPFSGQGAFCGMAVEHADVVITPDPFWADFERTGDAAHIGRSWAGIWRGVLGPTLAGALDPDRDRSAVLDAFFSGFATRVAASPREQRNAIALVTLRKT